MGLFWLLLSDCSLSRKLSEQGNHEPIKFSGMAVSDIGRHVLQSLSMKLVETGEHGELLATSLSVSEIDDLKRKFETKVHT